MYNFNNNHNMDVPKLDEVCEESDEDKSLSQLICLNKKKKRPSDNTCQNEVVGNCSRHVQKKKKKIVVNQCKEEEKDNKIEASNEEENGKVEKSEDRPGPCKNCSYCSDHCPPEKERKLLNGRVECADCKKKGIRRTFKSKESLATHVKYAHSDEDDPSSKIKFVCSMCANIEPVLFTSKIKYLNHMVSQHQTHVFICDLCSSSFILKANYKAHMLTHNVTPKKAFKCDVCNGTFVNRAGYEAHKRRFPGPHTKHTCGHCGVSFSKEKHMKNHRCKKLLLEEAAAKAAESNVKYESSEAVDEQVFRPVTVSVSEPLMIQEVHDSRDSEQLIIRELSGQMVPGTQVLQFEMGDVEQPQQVYQVNVADWNMVAPFVIRDPNLTTIHQAGRSPD